MGRNNSIPKLPKDSFEGVPADIPVDKLRAQLDSLGIQRTPEQHAEHLANQNAAEKQMQAQSIQLK